MANNPHVLAAMAACSIVSTIRPSSEKGNQTTIGPSLPDLAHGIKLPNKHTFPVLEAIASLCIYEPQHQVAAVAIQMNPSRRTIRLTIAGNAGVDPKVISHVQGIWEMLKNLSGQYAATQQRETGKVIRCELVKQIYTFSWHRNQKRIDKWWKRLREFGLNLMEAPFWADDTSGLKKCFEDSFILLLRSIEMLQGPHTDDWRRVSTMMSGATINLKKILDHEFICEIWASKMKVGTEPFPLRRALEKVTDQHRHINTLISFAHSPRFRFVFVYTISVESVPQSSRGFTLPRSPAAWQSVINETCRHHTFKKSFTQEESLKLTESYRNAKQDSPVHCECSLIAFLETIHNNEWDRIPAFSFIGVSKLSCGLCHNWIKAFNSLGGCQYHTKGCHDKWYWPWAMPVLPILEARVASAFTDLIREEYIKFHVAEGRMRAKADSTDTSSEGAGVVLDHDDEDECQTEVAQWRAARTGKAFL